MCNKCVPWHHTVACTQAKAWIEADKTESQYLFGPSQSHLHPSRPPWAAQARTQYRAEVSQTLSLLKRQLLGWLLLLAQLPCWQLQHLPHETTHDVSICLQVSDAVHGWRTSGLVALTKSHTMSWSKGCLISYLANVRVVLSLSVKIVQGNVEHG